MADTETGGATPPRLHHENRGRAMADSGVKAGGMGFLGVAIGAIAIAVVGAVVTGFVLVVLLLIEKGNTRTGDLEIAPSLVPAATPTATIAPSLTPQTIDPMEQVSAALLDIVNDAMADIATQLESLAPEATPTPFDMPRSFPPAEAIVAAQMDRVLQAMVAENAWLTDQLTFIAWALPQDVWLELSSLYVADRQGLQYPEGHPAEPVGKPDAGLWPEQHVPDVPNG